MRGLPVKASVSTDTPSGEDGERGERENLEQIYDNPIAYRDGASRERLEG